MMITFPCATLTSSLQKLPFWVGGVAIASLVLVAELLRYFDNATSIPFLFMIVVVALSSSLNGFRSGFISAAVWISYLIYSYFVSIRINFIPNTGLQVISEIVPVLLLVVLQGCKKFSSDRTTQTLRQYSNQLDHQVRRRTIELANANVLLTEQIRDREITLQNLQQTEAELRQSEARLLLALEASHMGIWDWDMTTGKIAWSSGHEQLFGLAPNTFDGRYKTFDDRLHPDDRASLNRAVETALRDRITYRHEFRVVWKDGSIHWIAGKGRAFYDETGKAVRMTGTIVDIDDRKQIEIALQQAHEGLEVRVEERTAELTDVNDRLTQELQERRKVEKALRESRALLQAIIDNSPAVIYLVDAQNKILLVNRQHDRVFNLSKENFVGKTIDEVFPPAIAATFNRRNQAVLEAGHPIEAEDDVQYHDGTIHTAISIRFPLFDEAGVAQMVCGICTDITERAQIARLKDEFVSVVSHELRTPLTSIYGALNLLSEGLVEPQSEWGQRTIAIAAEGAEHLVRLVDDILDLERLQSGKISLAIQPCNLADLMKTAIERMQVMADQSQVRLAVSPVAVQIEADGDRLIQVLTNLLSNAIKFSPPDATVRLTAEIQEEGAILVQVSDQGRGIAEAQLELIFDRFHQVDASDARQKGGTGLGLAICRSIIQQHGGQIWAESTIAKGSRFSFMLPIA